MSENPTHPVSTAAPSGGDGGSGDNVRPFRYDAGLATEIELRWQDRWSKLGTFESPNPTGPLGQRYENVAGRKKFFVLDMFPYPSGSGLHVGHPLGYIGTDVYARYLRMSGHHVLHSFGYDAFGLPAEQYAIDTGQHPAVTTAANVANMRRQLRRLGLGHDQRREVSTTDVGFYRWTQWIFLKLFNAWVDPETNKARPIDDLIAEFESGSRQPVSEANPEALSWSQLDSVQRRKVVDSYRLAFVSHELVNWCPGLGTVLANEEVTAEGRSDVGNYPVYRRPLQQWMLRITAYADRLIEDLDLVDWPESIKLMQRNWIGASTGAHIDFPVVGAPEVSIRVFTTRPDTLTGATYMVVAPEHPLLDQLVPAQWPEGTPQQWRNPTGKPTQDGAVGPKAAVTAYQEQAAHVSDRQRTAETTTKTGVFTGAYVTNPATGQPIPVFIADYVLMGYGTGAIMAVPAHDQRDLDFARTFTLPLRTVIQPPESWFTDQGLDGRVPVEAWPVAFSGDGEYVAALPSGPRLVGMDKARGIEASISWLEVTKAGTATRSYRLRDWLFSRQRYWGEPFPIVYDEHGPLAVPEDQLPVTLPEMSDFKAEPQEDENADPVPPLAKAREWAQVELDLGDGLKTYRRELNTMPQWAGSCWYYLRYLDPTNADAFVDPDVERYWMVPEGAAEGEGGVDLYVGGVEHAVLHLLYARFWHKVLFDLGHVSTKEPFKRLFNQGYIQADAYRDSRGMPVPAAEIVEHEDGSCTFNGEPVTRHSGKMGKSLKNSVSPDEIYASYGADTLRLYEMAMGPLDSDRPWRTHDMVGMYRFLQKLWRNLVDEDTGALKVADVELDEASTRKLHQTILAVRTEFEHLRYNTAIARLIELNTHAGRVLAATGVMPRVLAEPLLLMLAPLAPHIAEELWQRLGHTESLAHTQFPIGDEVLAAENSIALPVQVNGKRRFDMQVPADADQAAIEKLLFAHPEYTKYTEGVQVRRLVIVPGRIANIVVS